MQNVKALVHSGLRGNVADKITGHSVRPLGMSADPTRFQPMQFIIHSVYNNNNIAFGDLNSRRFSTVSPKITNIKIQTMLYTFTNTFESTFSHVVLKVVTPARNAVLP